MTNNTELNGIEIYHNLASCQNKLLIFSPLNGYNGKEAAALNWEDYGAWLLVLYNITNTDKS
jgi:hypothetical protein